MTDHPLVSVIVPSFNCAGYIRQTLLGVVAQTHEQWEVIVVDDGSQDETVAIASAIDPRIRVIRQANAGVCAARNRGFAQAKGEFICFLDHDDFWFSEKLARQIAWMRRMPEVGMIFSTFILWREDEHGRFPEPAELLSTDTADVLDPDFTGWVYHQFLLDCHALTSCAMFRRTALECVGAFDTSIEYSEDWELYLRLSREFPFARMRWPTTLYRQHRLQGSRAVRSRDFRTQLLLGARRRWGLASRDGRHVSQRAFQRRIAEFRMEFGYFHLALGKRALGIRSLLQAWTLHPLRLRYLALALAGLGGWRPRP